MDGLSRFQEVCKQRAVVDFARQVLLESYTEYMPEPPDLIDQFLDQIFSALTRSCTNNALFAAEVERLGVEVFQQQQDSFWFNRHYKAYKRSTKPYHRVIDLEPLLCGNKVLDFGCGGGLTSLALSQKGYQVYLADEIDYRDKTASHLPFHATIAEESLPFPDQFFDDVVIFGVLHHIEAPVLSALLSELARVTRRIIIEEDVYALPEALPGLAEQLSHDEQLRWFVRLSPADQKDYLMFLDYYANILVHGITNMNMPFGFRTMAEWQTIFADQGLATVATIPKGFQKKFLHRSSHVWFVLEKASAASM